MLMSRSGWFAPSWPVHELNRPKDATTAVAPNRSSDDERLGQQLLECGVLSQFLREDIPQAEEGGDQSGSVISRPSRGGAGRRWGRPEAAALPSRWSRCSHI